MNEQRKFQEWINTVSSCQATKHERA